MSSRDPGVSGPNEPSLGLRHRHSTGLESAAELPPVLAGSDTVALIYKGHRGLSTEVFHFSASGKVSAAFAHYATAP